jgi:hypothetical protein
MKQFKKLSLVFLLLSSSIFFLPLKFKSTQTPDTAGQKHNQANRAETGAMELHKHAGIASLQ